MGIPTKPKHCGRTRPRIMKKVKQMKSTTLDHTQFRDLAHRAIVAGGFLIIPARPFSRLGSALLAGHKVLASATLGLLMGIPCVADAQEYAFTPIDVPGATRTAAAGNSNTAVVGEYDDADGNTHGFILSQGVFTTIDLSGASSTQINGINAPGRYTGTYFDPDAGRIYAFVSRKGDVTTLDPPGAIQSQGGFLNAQGEVVGGYRNSNGRRLAFVWRKGVFTTIDPEPAATLGPVAFGINEKGDIVGTYVDTDNNRHGFLWTESGYTTLDVPGAVFTIAQGINNAGQIVGLYLATDGTFHGFVLSDGVYTTVDVPGSSSTSIYSINPKGEIAGEFENADGIHGFLGTPAH